MGVAGTVPLKDIGAAFYAFYTSPVDVHGNIFDDFISICFFGYSLY